MKKHALTIGMYSGGGTLPRRLARLLRGWGFDVKPLREGGMASLEPGDFDVLYLPGGWYFFNPGEKRAIVNYVKGGGGCVGSCAGAYNIAGYIPVIPGKVLRTNMRGRLYLEPVDGGHPILRGVVRRCTRHRNRKWEPIAVALFGGPLILPEDRKSIVASYDTEGTIAAIAASQRGKGRAVALACHSEHRTPPLAKGDPALGNRASLVQGNEALIVRNAVLWAARRHVPWR